MNEAKYLMKNYGDLGGCYPPRPTASTDNTLLNLHNSSYDTKAEFNNFFYYSFKIIPSLEKKNILTSIDVKFTFDSARLGLFGSTNIFQLADVTLRIVFLLFLLCFQLLFHLVLTLEASEMSASFCFHNQNNLTSSPGLLA